MAFSPTYTVQIQNGSLAALFTDTTGDYSSSNTGGWGTPNPAKTAVVGATLTVYPPDPETLIPNGAAYVLPLTNLLSSSYPLVSQIGLLPVDFGMGDNNTKIPDGVWGFRLNVTLLIGGNDVVLAPVDYFTIFTKQTECCINGMFKNGCKCGDIKRTLLEAKYAILAAGYAMECDNIQDAADNLKFAINVCNKKKCGNCGC